MKRDGVGGLREQDSARIAAWLQSDRSLMAAVSCMQISQESSFGARVYDTVHGAHRILPLSVSVQGQRCRLVVGRLEHELPPYRIENRCDTMRFPSAMMLEAHRLSAGTPQACSSG